MAPGLEEVVVVVVVVEEQEEEEVEEVSEVVEVEDMEGGVGGLQLDEGQRFLVLLRLRRLAVASSRLVGTEGGERLVTPAMSSR